MKTRIVHFLLLVVVASALSFTEDYGEAFTNLLRQMRLKPCEFDPMTHDSTNFNYVKGDTNIEGTLNNSQIWGLSNFQILRSKYDASAMHHILDIIFASIQILGSLDLKGTLGIAGFALPLDEDIRINIKVTDLRIIADYTFGQSLTNPNGLRISDFDVKIFVSDVKVDNWDESMDIALNTFSNDFLGSLSVLLSKELRPYVNNMLDYTVKEKQKNFIRNPNYKSANEEFDKLAKNMYINELPLPHPGAQAGSTNGCEVIEAEYDS
ncbi:hypothetical protein ACLKA6_019875 [Drosophila palustris]